MRTLLIVDDEMVIANGLRDMLAAAFQGRLNVICRYSSATALEAAGEQPVDLLLTDINMPGVTGLELHRAMEQLHPGCMVIYLTGYSDFEYARTALDQQAFAYLLKGEGDDVVISAIERALEKLPEEAAFSTASPSDATAEGIAPSNETRSGNRISLLQDYILAHLNEDLSLNRLSDEFHFHPVYLSRVFKEALGVTIGDYINQERLKRAEELLVNSRLSVVDISREMGFATDNYFCRWFRKWTGISPHRYRENHRDLSQ
jgi:YesN/AraC family two-component response regulator